MTMKRIKEVIATLIIIICGFTIVFSFSAIAYRDANQLTLQMPELAKETFVKDAASTEFNNALYSRSVEEGATEAREVVFINPRAMSPNHFFKILKADSTGIEERIAPPDTEIFYTFERTYSYPGSNNDIHNILVEHQISKDKLDRFGVNIWAIDALNTVENMIPVIILLSAVIGGLSLFFLLSTEMKYTDTKPILLRDRIPLELFVVLILVIYGTLAASIVETLNGFAGVYDVLFMFILTFGTALVLVTLSWLKSVCVRAKTRTFFGNSLTNRWVINPVKDGIHSLAHEKEVKRKLVFIIIVWGIINVYLLTRMGGFGVVIFMGELCALIFYGSKVFDSLIHLKVGAKTISEGNLDYKIDVDDLVPFFKEQAEVLNDMSEGLDRAVIERMKAEHFKSELITNVSHDIKTPLTSIINYVDLLDTKDQMDDEAKEYIEVLNRQSYRLKKLIDDLMDASKATSGNLNVSLEPINIDIFMEQIMGEYEESLAQNELEVITTIEDLKPIFVDTNLFHRVLDNVMINIVKYAADKSRVYIDILNNDNNVVLIFKNISKEPLNISENVLMERFTRGDASRHTEGSGLGLSIAKAMTELQKGTFTIKIDGDLFKVEISLPMVDK